jgi:hypothetical protein
MDDITSRDEEKAREQAREKELKAEKDRQMEEQKAKELAAEKGRQEERDRQKERDQATEKGRKQGKEEERASQKAKGGSGIIIVIALIVLVVIAAAIAWFSVSATVTDVTPGVALPFATNYAVSFPEGQTVTLGNSHINVLSAQNEVITDIDGAREKLVVGDQRVIPERRGRITIFGVTLADVNYKITLTYKGERDNRAYFDMTVQTSKQIPDMFLNRLLPGGIDARRV